MLNSLSIPYKTFLMIPAIPNKDFFWIISNLMFILIFHALLLSVLLILHNLKYETLNPNPKTKKKKCKN